MPRFHDLVSIPFHLPTGTHNAITDVDGVRVGHTTLIEGEDIRTGCTAILPHGDNVYQQKVLASVFTINGYGKAMGFEQVRDLGTIETPILLTNTLNVGKVADAVVSYSIHHNPEIGKTVGTVNPVVDECNDGYLNDIQRRVVNEEHVFHAIESASSGTVAEGNVGAGTGTVCYGFKGGIGTASRVVLDGEFTVGTLVQTNFGTKPELRILGVPIGQQLAHEHQPKTGDGSIVMVIATDAPLTTRQLHRLTKRTPFGLARTGTVCHHGSGDFVIAFSTANRIPNHSSTLIQTIDMVNEEKVMNDLFRAVVETIEESVYNALVSAETLEGRDRHILHALPHDKIRQLRI